MSIRISQKLISGHFVASALPAFSSQGTTHYYARGELLNLVPSFSSSPALSSSPGVIVISSVLAANLVVALSPVSVSSGHFWSLSLGQCVTDDWICDGDKRSLNNVPRHSHFSSLIRAWERLQLKRASLFRLLMRLFDWPTRIWLFIFRPNVHHLTTMTTAPSPPPMIFWWSVVTCGGERSVLQFTECEVKRVSSRGRVMLMMVNNGYFLCVQSQLRGRSRRYSVTFSIIHLVDCATDMLLNHFRP